MYLLYLKYKAFLVIHRKVLHKIGNVLVGFVVLSLAVMIVVNYFQEYFSTTTELLVASSFVTSALSALLSAVVFHDRVSDLDKKILCQNLSTGYKRCDELIELIIKTARKRHRFKFKYGHEFDIAMDDIIDEPYVIDLGYSYKDLIIYPCTTHPGVLFLRELLYSIVEEEKDYVRLEKILLDIGC